MATFTFSDNVRITGYGVNQSNTEEPTYVETNNTSVTWTASNAGTYYVWVKDTVGNKSNETFTIVSTAFCAYNVGQTWNYDYTGGIQSFSIPCNGTYKLEVWGAQGGNVTGSLGTGIGGYGGYATGNVLLSQNQSLYIVVGGAGSSGIEWKVNVASGGYNGGGQGKTNNQYGGAGGGGATHIGTRVGTLAQYGNTTGLYIVAGGGGGGNYDCTSDHEIRHGGYGGGTSGGTNGLTSTGGSQNSAGSGSDRLGGFGFGGWCPTYGQAGGGGGLYGGGSGCGGSGYIGGVSGGSMQNGARSGNGYARITLISISN